MTTPDAMRGSEQRPTVVVGWDGSAAARLALATAAHLAQGGCLIAVHAHEAVAPHVTARWQELLGLAAAERSSVLLGQLSGGAVDGLQEVQVDTRSVEGDPAVALMAVASEVGADVIAVGSRGIGASAADQSGELVVDHSVSVAGHGSVSAALLARADRPVLVVPPRAVGI